MSETEEGASFNTDEYEYKELVHELMDEIVLKIHTENPPPVFPFAGENGNPVFELKLQLDNLGEEYFVRVYGKVGRDRTWEKGEIFTIILYQIFYHLDKAVENWQIDISDFYEHSDLELLQKILETGQIKNITMRNPDPESDDLISTYTDYSKERGAFDCMQC